MRSRNPLEAGPMAVSAVLLAVVLAGCSTRLTVTTRTLVRTPEPTSTWMGRTVEEVERVWGNSPQRESDGEGGTVLVYRRDTSLSVSSETAPSPNPNNPGPRDVASRDDPNRTQTQRITKDSARFWVDGKGTVYRYWFSQQVYDEGRDTPPPAEPIE